MDLEKTGKVAVAVATPCSKARAEEVPSVPSHYTCICICMFTWKTAKQNPVVDFLLPHPKIDARSHLGSPVALNCNVT